MRVFHFFMAMIVTVTLMACSAPNINIFGESREPLREITLSGSGDDKVLLISISGTISDVPIKDSSKLRPVWSSRLYPR